MVIDHYHMTKNQQQGTVPLFNIKKFSTENLAGNQEMLKIWMYLKFFKPIYHTKDSSLSRPLVISLDRAINNYCCML